MSVSCAGTCTRSFRRCATRWRATSSERTTSAAGVPGPGSGQPTLEVPARLPAKLGLDRARVEELPVDLTVRRALTLDARLHLHARDRNQAVDDVAHRDRRAGPRVPGLAPVRLAV